MVVLVLGWEGRGRGRGFEGCVLWCWLVDGLRSLVLGLWIGWWGFDGRVDGVGGGRDGTVEFGVGGGYEVRDQGGEGWAVTEGGAEHC